MEDFAEINDIDTEIIDEFENEDKLYNDFYKDPLEEVRLFIFCNFLI